MHTDLSTHATGSELSAPADDAAFLRRYPADVDWSAPITPNRVDAILDRAVRNFPNKPCCNFLGRQTTYAEIGAEVEKTAAALKAIGVEKGTRIGLFLPNCPTFIVYYYAAMKLGAIVVNYNPLYTIEELRFQVEDSGTEIMVTLDLKILFDKVDELLALGVLKRAIVGSFPALLPPTKAVLYKLLKGKELANLKRAKRGDLVLHEDQLPVPPEPFQPTEISPHDDIAVLQYTGGTTGTPKGAMLTHANLSANIQQLEYWAPSVEVGKERVLGALPFFHVFAMTVVMNFAISRAAEILIMPRFVLNDALKLITKGRPTVMPGVPTIFNAINNHPKLKSFDLSSLKFCLSGGAALPLEVKTEFERLAGCALIEGYGLSETAPVATCNPIEGPAKDKSIGVPLPRTRLSLRSIDDPNEEVALGEKGEICIAGPQVMRGYWQRPEATADAFIGPYFRTGDVAVQDDDGFYFIVDRIKDLILCSGYNVYPRRIEDAIQAHTSVEEVTVIGIPDSYRGEAPKAYVKIKAGLELTTADLLAHLEPKLSKIEMPSEIEFRDELPKTMIGKLSKKELKAEIEASA
ncbi:MAG: long-chain fatty acid--CoA ligase [Pseudomonadota bacterium]